MEVDCNCVQEVEIERVQEEELERVVQEMEVEAECGTLVVYSYIASCTRHYFLNGHACMITLFELYYIGLISACTHKLVMLGSGCIGYSMYYISGYTI